MTPVVYTGGPCTCRAGRYIRFAIPAAPGCAGVISCRGNDSAREDVREHPIPTNATVLIRMPEMRL